MAEIFKGFIILLKHLRQRYTRFVSNVGDPGNHQLRSIWSEY